MRVTLKSTASRGTMIPEIRMFWFPRPNWHDILVAYLSQATTGHLERNGV